VSNKFSRDRFVEFLIKSEVLLFGDFELNSGRKSPYFFNLGSINSGQALQSLGDAYARTIIENDIRVDVLFGPAYKGIPIAVSTSMALGMMGSDVGFAFNRKEAKNHGEGGDIVGADVRRKVLILDDVLTSGKALKESIGILKSNGAEVVGALVALNRDEIDENKQTARQLLEEAEGINVISICSIKDVVTYLEKDPERRHFAEKIRDYQSVYCSRD
jgi:orotate phosphoribosyltransferase